MGCRRWSLQVRGLQGPDVSTAGTLFDRRRSPLTVWLTACWMFASQKDGVSALSLQRSLEIGSYPTAWAMLHRLRWVLVRPGRDRLTGTVEVDETYIGGEEPGLRGGRKKGKKSLVGVAVELRQPRGYGRCRMILRDGSAASLHPFVTEHVEPGATVITDAWQGYRGINKLGYTHEPRSQRAARARGQDPGELLPGVHRVASLVKRWLPAGYPPGLGRRSAPTGLPQRVRVPLQPARIPEQGAGLPPRARTRRRARSSALPRLGRQPAAEGGATRAARDRRAPAEHGPPPSGAAMESILTWVSPVS